ncbi:BpsFReDn22 [Biomphalaria pfeifferi]|uniref:BpsFReDn22 n=1 Tax=Biomphalaria pfeifferi TaxID=112525 RepID=A0AAD8C1W1_BIOPF|nr:BpsFReDn22 [Biomphalaria pfeifferi]
METHGVYLLLLSLAAVFPSYRCALGNCPRKISLPCLNSLMYTNTLFPQEELIANMDGYDSICDSSDPKGLFFVIQRRYSGSSVDWNLDWETYKTGFGSQCGDFYLGNENIYQLTVKASYLLRIKIDFQDTNFTFYYSGFRLGSEEESYRLTLGITDSANKDLLEHNGMNFSTYDRSDPNGCACFYSSGWWYNSCFKVNLFGDMQSTENSFGAIWESITGYGKSLKFTEMAILSQG